MSKTSASIRTPQGGLRLSHSNMPLHSCSSRLSGSPRRKATRKPTSPARMRCIAARTCCSGRWNRRVKLATSASKTITMLATMIDAETTNLSTVGIAPEVSPRRCDTHSIANHVAAMHIATNTEIRSSMTGDTQSRKLPLRWRTGVVVSGFDTGSDTGNAHVKRTPARLHIAPQALRPTRLISCVSHNGLVP
ncbi:MAG: hypothetical protein ACJAUC_001872 [Planctomycetota bacterium]|jgi:hypothetical protein